MAEGGIDFLGTVRKHKIAQLVTESGFRVEHLRRGVKGGVHSALISLTHSLG